jgi:hypothetical protein
MAYSLSSDNPDPTVTISGANLIVDATAANIFEWDTRTV